VSEAVVRAVGLEKRYGLRTVLRDVSFELESGGALVVTGPNGAGKSTLLRLIGGLAAPSRGSLEIGRTEAESASSGTSRSSIAS
jgi:ABC-type multidrug transport system ATPase subunit